MIDTNQLSALISAFHVETEKESISPETVGKLLQDIVDLLATASTDAERQNLDDWKTMLSQYVVVYDVAHATGMADMEHMFLTLKGRSLRNGATFTSSVPLSAATDMQAGVMSASHVQTLPRRSRGRACDTPRGNSGDIGRAKVRQRRKWFSRKYNASVMNIKEFYEDNIGRSFTGILSDFAI